MRLFLHVLCFLPLCEAMIRGINLESFPFIVDLSTMKSFIWDNGVTAEWISRSPAISVSSRGVRFIHPSFHVIHDDDYILCDRTRGALCESASGFRVFPYDTARVGFLGGSGCDEVFSGRTVIFSKDLGDVSLCDVVSGHRTVLYTQGSYLYVRDGFLGDIEYGFISAVGVFIIAYSVHRATTSEGSGAFLSSIVMCVCVSGIVTVLATQGSFRLYATYEDMASFFFILLYCVSHVLRWSWLSISHAQVKSVPHSVILGTLCLMTLRLFATVDNPCSPLLLIFLIFRIFSRVMLDTFRGDIIRTLDLYLDTVFAGIITTYGFIPQYTAVEKAVLHLMLIVSVLFSFGGYFYKKPEAVNDKV